MLRFAAPMTAIVAVILCGTVHGLWTDRWDSSDEPAVFAARLPTVPLSAGDWEGQEADSKNPKVPGVIGTLHRRYVHRRTGKEATVYIVCGRPGPVSIHTPEVCYSASGYEVLAQTNYTLPLESAPAQFRTAQFRKKQSSDVTCLRIFWAWSGDGSWSAPAEPRFAFARHPALFKLYVIREMASDDESLDDDPCLDLLRNLVPALQQSLAPTS
ncbi:MAG: EpsI family protein [Gemmataceae bacterium]|nr:EpsI family protein [Gemmataceae bacterium]